MPEVGQDTIFDIVRILKKSKLAKEALKFSLCYFVVVKK